jgi:hypothetical protein
MRVIALAGALCLLGLGLGFAPRLQTSAGTVAGSVTDPAGLPLAGVTVRLDAKGRTPFTTLSDAAGAFTLRRVPVADYEVTATLPRFATFTTHVSVRPGVTAHLAIVLQSGAANQTAPQ